MFFSFEDSTLRFQVIELPVRTNQIPRQIPEQVEYYAKILLRKKDFQ